MCRLFLWNHVQPWLKLDMRDLILTAPDYVRRRAFIALHIADGNSDAGNLRAPISVEVTQADFFSRGDRHVGGKWGRMVVGGTYEGCFPTPVKAFVWMAAPTGFIPTVRAGRSN